MKEYIEREALLERNMYGNAESILYRGYAQKLIKSAPTADVVEVKAVSEQIIRKKAEVSDYWLNNVKQYRATQGYADIEHDADNFLRGYNEAVEDMLAILDGKPQKEGNNG